MFAKTLELSLASKPTFYVRFMFGILISLLIGKTVWFSRLGYAKDRPLIDFDAFYIAAQRVWLGDIDQAYQFAKMVQMQNDSLGGSFNFMPWTYPPQFDVFVAPLSLLSVGAAYLLFIVATLGLYLTALRLIAGDCFALVLLALFPALAVVIACGQNGFLTGALIGFVCLTIQRRQVLAGLSLGMMVIKPHLALAFAAYSLFTRRWIAVLVAASFVAASSALSTILLGPRIWVAFFGGLQEAGSFLQHGLYPLFRMISPYAALRSAGIPALAAFVGQASVAILGLLLICLAIYRGFASRRSLGLTAIVSVLISPYAYDYDLPVFGIGLALLLPDLVRLGSEWERATIYVLTFLTGLYGAVQGIRLSVEQGSNVLMGDYSGYRAVSIGGITIAAMLGIAWRILQRDYKNRPSTTDGAKGDEGFILKMAEKSFPGR